MTIPYVPALDGLRAVALLLVVSFHVSYGRPGGGFIGVDVFFVLSGFLITSLLVTENRTSETISLADFYWRRARRLLPALVVTIIAGALIVTYIPQAEGTRPYPIAALAVLAYVGNWLRIAALGPLAHTWSLSIEEQFYVLWPPTLRHFLRRGWGTSGLVGLVVAAAALCFGIGAALSLAGSWNDYEATVPRFGELLVGVTLGLYLNGQFGEHA